MERGSNRSQCVQNSLWWRLDPWRWDWYDVPKHL